MQADVLVVGAGVAGLCAALSAAPRRVALLCPDDPVHSSSSAMAQGGMAAALDPADSVALHAADTLAAACHSADPHAVAGVVEAARGAVAFLEANGVAFDRNAGGHDLHLEAGHSRARIVHAEGDQSGRAIVQALWCRVRRAPHVDLLAGWRAVQLATHRERGVGGIHAVDAQGRQAIIDARDTVLATGGIGQLFARTTNGPYATGDGLAMAMVAGAATAALEFVQFHPTALHVPADPLPLLTEALRGAGARLVTASGRPVMAGRHPLGDLAPRDEVARAVWEVASSGEDVLLDARAIFSSPRGAEYPGAHQVALLHGLDPAKVALPVTAAAHYHMGGVAVDPLGRTNLPRLWACGEVAHTGLHGANRLASNSLLEAVVCGRSLGRALSARAGTPAPSPRARAGLVEVGGLDLASGPAWQQVRELMWTAMGPSRERATLLHALHALRTLRAHLPSQRWLLRQRLLLPMAMVRAALERRESRGAHWRRDYPRRNPLRDGPRAVRD